MELKAKDGNNFIGMVHRDNHSYESIGQFLPSKLKKNKLYYFSLHWANSEHYFSPAPFNPNLSKEFRSPTRLIISLENSTSPKPLIVFELETIFNTDWQEELLIFTSPCDCDVLIIEANYQVDQERRGHILIDKISNLFRIEQKE